MNTTEYFKEQFGKLQTLSDGGQLEAFRNDAFNTFKSLGIPTSRHEEWKYTRVGSLFNKAFDFPLDNNTDAVSALDIDAIRLPGNEQANELVFINGQFSPSRSTIRSADLVVLPLGIAANNEYKEIVAQHLGHSSEYQKDGINALNTAFVHGGVFVFVKKAKVIEHPVYIYNITDARSVNIFSQPRSLVYVSEQAQLQMVETYATLGSGESFTNQVMEVIVEKAAIVSYYKLQNDAAHANQVSTTHIRQIGKSYTHSVTISLNGGIIRNNLNIVLEAAECESHLYGLYFQEGATHVDNHTVVDNVMPNCFSNELYKGILTDNASGVFDGKIFVQRDAQKTNAYQSNKNVLLSDSANVNTKPQLEIFADDVKCSHGCTVGRLNEEGLFYLRARGINEKTARALLLQAYAIDIIEQIKPEPIRSYVEKLIAQRLEI